MTPVAARAGRLLVAAGVAEAATGVALLLVPALVVRLLLGQDLAPAAEPVARVAGIALVGLGVACWPGPPRIGMLTYGGTITVYLGWLGLAGTATGVLLWPAVILHALLFAGIAYRGKPAPT